MKPIRSMAGALAGIALAFALAGCGPKGGTLTLVNESSYKLSSPSISLGDGNEDVLMPGQWMQSEVDKNVAGATVTFSVESSDAKNKVTMTHSGNWVAYRWTSSLIGVQKGESVVLTVRNKKE